MKPSPEWSSASIQTEIDALKHKPGALLPILHALQDRFGFIPTDAIALIAASLQQTRAEIHGVISFYHHFRTTPPGRHVVQICRAEACQSVGGRQLEAHAKARLGVDYHQTTPDREITLEAVYCLGNCACGPSIRVDDQVRGRVTEEAFDELLDELQTRPLEVSA
ncbi:MULTISPECIES: formate dehydrogenase subunit gamma [unclassified Halomonas]|uniref:formate dehydrogenase subunit gamma n=1 Tax=unclassified Halomonas TaxID=2609666 RepID=UPI0020A04C8B|nr:MULTISPECIES: formate dehydrogenase subunit gamma [unclassified Halomonas]MCP1314135.1 formate dehydrogenase subunit gamma [Halomonas sp. 707D7]MCP1328521.1 formate dehydrogenase subunit gamma [Halomonas sp. 707D4]